MLIIHVQGVLGLKSLVRVDYHGSAPRTSAACSSSLDLKREAGDQFHYVESNEETYELFQKVEKVHFHNL